MWQDIIDQAKRTLTGRVQNGVGINPVQAENAVQLAGETSRDVLVQEARDGNVDGIISLFTGEDETSTSHPIAIRISEQLRGKLVNGLGLQPEDAKKVEHATVPYFLKLVDAQLNGDAVTPDTKGVTPHTANIETIFGGPGTMSEGEIDKLKRALGDRI